MEPKLKDFTRNNKDEIIKLLNNNLHIVKRVSKANSHNQDEKKKKISIVKKDLNNLKKDEINFEELSEIAVLYINNLYKEKLKQTKQQQQQDRLNVGMSKPDQNNPLDPTPDNKVLDKGGKRNANPTGTYDPSKIPEITTDNNFETAESKNEPVVEVTFDETIIPENPPNKMSQFLDRVREFGKSKGVVNNDFIKKNRSEIIKIIESKKQMVDQRTNPDNNQYIREKDYDLRADLNRDISIFKKGGDPSINSLSKTTRGIIQNLYKNRHLSAKNKKRKKMKR